MVHAGQEVVMIGGSHALHQHEKLAIALSKAMRGHSLQKTKNDGQVHVHTKTHLDSAILKEEMERSADMLAAGLLEMSQTLHFLVNFTFASFVFSLADVDPHLMMEDESLVWTSNDVIVLQHQIPPPRGLDHVSIWQWVLYVLEDFTVLNELKLRSTRPNRRESFSSTTGHRHMKDSPLLPAPPIVMAE
ncbi:hypothetical protein RHSIM_Rhsim05G0134500 [Rhododendron simsii]|uniref:Uncharacterized protein n=1 Tax=Rhododendron simsii TaxID=118357 RepID=A0A834GX25_RHOSS|nr:hypothetical protein RHSIM_Rhsim05G0134500 [Rhododendron simsii]